MIDEKSYQDAIEYAAAAPPASGLFDVLKRARAAGVKMLDIIIAIVSNKGNVAGMIKAIEDLIAPMTTQKPPAP